METRSIALTTPVKAIHPENGWPIKVIGVTDEDSLRPKLVALVTDLSGMRVEIFDQVKNDRS